MLEKQSETARKFSEDFQGDKTTENRFVAALIRKIEGMTAKFNASQEKMLVKIKAELTVVEREGLKTVLENMRTAIEAIMPTQE